MPWPTPSGFTPGIFWHEVPVDRGEAGGPAGSVKTNNRSDVYLAWSATSGSPEAEGTGYDKVIMRRPPGRGHVTIEIGELLLHRRSLAKLWCGPRPALQRSPTGCPYQVFADDPPGMALLTWSTDKRRLVYP